MNTRIAVALCAFLACAATAAAADEAAIARRGYDVLKQYCHRCHGVDFKAPGLNVLDRDVLTANRGEAGPAYVVPGQADDSYLWQRAGLDADMPPDGAAQPSDEDRQAIRDWIAAGAPFPQDRAAEFVATRDVMFAVRDELRRTGESDRPFLRFFTLGHLSGNPSVTEDELRLYRAALSKVVNSLSWQPEIVVPRAIDERNTVFALDLRDVGWDEGNLWREILRAYPYGLNFRTQRDGAMREAYLEIAKLSGSDQPAVRVDWFVAQAARPPLYHQLLRLPETAGELEQQLNVDVERNFLRDRLARAGFATSGVSAQNRLVERHAAAHGAYWKSYDFKSDEGQGNLFRFPLGPEFEGQPFPRHAFRHDGGELIFHLPNGLQGYLLVDGQDRRIDAGPIEVVSDSLSTSGTPAIVNGLSCMACHKHGMLPCRDTVRGGNSLAGEARLKLDRLFPPQEEMDRLLAADSERFLRALEAATADILCAGADAAADIRSFPEPVGAIARLYLKDIGTVEAACELGLADPTELQIFIRANPRLRELGLGPLADGERIKRAAWESVEGFTSPFQEAARELELGTPFRAF